MLDRKVRVGIAGYGVVGKRRATEILKRTDAHLVAVCDQHLTKEARDLSQPFAQYTDVSDLFTCKLDALIVCLPNYYAADVVCRALHLGLHVFCEKPPGRHLADISLMFEAKRHSTKSVLMFGFNHRYHDSVRKAKQIIDTGCYGKILSARGLYGKSQMHLFGPNEWRLARNIAGGGILLDQGIHLVDLVRYFAGEFREVESFISCDYWRHDVEDNAIAILRNSDGVLASIVSSATQWRHKFELDLVLENGSLLLEGLLTGSKTYGRETLTITTLKSGGPLGDPAQETHFFNTDNSWELEIEEFLSAVTSGHDYPNDIKEAFRTMMLISKIYYADRAWREKYNIQNPDDFKQLLKMED